MWCRQVLAQRGSLSFIVSAFTSEAIPQFETAVFIYLDFGHILSNGSWAIGVSEKTFFGSFPAINRIIIRFGAVIACYDPKKFIGRGQIFGGQLLGLRGRESV